MHLVAVTGGRRRPVVADRHRQEVKHQVRVVDVVVAATEPATLEVIRRADAVALQQPLRADAEPPRPRDRGIDGHRQPVRELHVDFEMVLQVFADSGQVDDGPDAEGFEQGGTADAGELQQLRRVDRSTAQNHFTGADGPSSASGLHVVDADRALALELHARHVGQRADGEIARVRMTGCR